MQRRDDFMVHALRVLMTTRRAFGLHTECHDRKMIMSFFRLCERAGCVGEIRGIDVRRGSTPAAAPTAQPVQGLGAAMRR